MELIDLVSELLYDKNCVIIPNFGGFVGNFKSTDFDKTRSLISPTRKRVAFNESLIENDGLLINALQTKKSISYDQAEKEVSLFVKFLKDRLTKYKNYEFKHLGSLYLNKEGKLVFVAYDESNFHKRSFGLQDVKVKRLTGVVEEEKVLIKQIEERKIVPIATQKVKKNFYFPQIAASVAILTIFGVMLWQLLQTSNDQGIVNNNGIDTAKNSPASIIPDISLSDSEYLEDSEIPETITNEMKFEDVTDEVIPAEIEEEPIQKAVSEEPVEVENYEVKEPITTTEPAENIDGSEPSETSSKYTPYTEKVYYIAVAKNYDAHKESAKRKNLESKEYQLFEQNINGTKLLCLEKFISEDNAKAFLNIVKRYDDREAFIFENQE